MLVNQIVPTEFKERICIHCDEKTPDNDPITYLIAGSKQGKTTETIRQAVFRRDAILSTEYDFFKNAGMKHVTEAKPGEICHMGLRDIFNLETCLKRDIRSGAIHICVDNGRAILEEVLTARFGVPIKIDFMSLEA